MMRTKRSISWLAMVLCLALMISILPHNASAEPSTEGFTITYRVENYSGDRNYLVAPFDAENWEADRSKGEEVNPGETRRFLPATEPEEYFNYYFATCIVSDFALDAEFLGFKIEVDDHPFQIIADEYTVDENAVIHSTHSDDGELHYISTRDFVSWNAEANGAWAIEYELSDELSVFLYDDTTLFICASACETFENITITAVYGEARNCTPTITKIDETQGNSSSFTTEFVSNTETGSMWTLTATCAQGRKLDYIRPANDESESVRIYPSAENGNVITWEVKPEQTEYYVYFADDVTPVESITLSQTSAMIQVGDELQLTATVLPENATFNTVEWSVSGTVGVISVDYTGKVTGLAPGTATVVAVTGSDGNSKSAMCTVTVEGGTPGPGPSTVAVESISLSESEVSINVGAVFALQATVAPEDATDKTVTWSCSDPSVAVIEFMPTSVAHDAAYIVGLSEGTVTITAQAGEFSKECIVKVKKNDLNALGLTIGAIRLEDESWSYSVGQVVGFKCGWAVTAAVPNGSTLYFDLFEGNGTTGKRIGTGYLYCSVGYGAGEYGTSADDQANVLLIIDYFPAGLTQITIAARFENSGEFGNYVTQVIEVSTLGIKDAGSMALTYLNIPGTKPGLTSQAACSDIGPDVYDVAIFADATNGGTLTYFATNDGVVLQGADGSFTTLYNGLSSAVADHDNLLGCVAAVGGTDTSGLYAVVMTQGEDTQITVWKLNNGTWSCVSTEPYTIAKTNAKTAIPACVINGNSIWLENTHWNGSAWVTNTVTFNSFWKDDQGTYAGSEGGLYVYENGDWRLVSGTSGYTRLLSGARVAGTVTLLTTTDTNTEQIFDLKKITLGSTVSVTTVDVSTFDGWLLGVGIDTSGTLYAFGYGESYNGNQFFWYQGTYLYKLVNGEWIYQIVDGFDDETDLANMAEGKYPSTRSGVTKVRPNGVTRTFSPNAGTTYFVGPSGAVYVKYGTATISFESNGGSAVEPITQTIGSAVTPPASPKRDGFTFSGWYLSDRDIAMGNAPYSWTVMPASDLSLYAKWTESSGESGDPFATEKENAKNSLATTLGRLKESDYEASVWTQIQAAYNSGVAAIAAATTYDGVYAALNGAVDELNELAKNTSGTITVAVTIEKLTVDGTYIIEPTLLTVNKYERASVVVTDLLKQYYASAGSVAGGYNGNPYRITGTETSNFYLAGIYDPSFNPATAGSSGQNAIGEEFAQNHAGFLSEFDGGQQSGWLYCVNGNFPGVGASAWTLVNGDVMRWQYTCTGLGSDVGADNSAWGDDTHVTVANKDALIWKIANINHDGTKAKYGEAYTDALTALQTITATQAAVDAALAALNAVDAAEEQAAADQAAAQAVDTEIEAIGEVTLESYAAITAARSAYDALTDTQKTLVTKLSVLTTAETAYAELKAAAEQEAVDAAAAKSVKELIEAIGEVSLDKEADITAARAAYNGLTEAQQALVTNLSDLTAAETKLAELKADKAAAEAVDGKIDAIGTVTLESESKITEARTAYDALSAAQKALVTKLPALAAAEETLAGLKADKAAAEAVETKIAAIGEVTLESETAITEARAAYDALTDAQKALVSNLATLTAAESRLAELKNGGEPVELTWQTALESVLAYLRGKVTNPSVGTLEGEWAVLAMNRGGAATDAWNNIYIENLKPFVDNCGGVLDTYKYTEYSRVILALTAAGVDASEFATDTATYDLVKPLLDKQTSGAYMAEKQGNNGTMFALLALNSHDYLTDAEGKAARAALIASLKANQMESGAWAISGKTTPDLDVTAAGVYALAPYYLSEVKLTALGGTVTYDEVKAMVESALDYLSAHQSASGGFGSVEADVWAIIALSSISRDADTDPAFVKAEGSLLQDMLGYFDESTGAFRHLMGEGIDQMATEQAAYGLVAYERYKNSKNTLYDMNDVRIASLEEKAKQAQADEVDELIAAIGEVTLESKAKIDAARAAYDGLTDEVKTKVSKLAVLEAAEAKYKELADAAAQAEIDEAAAKGADELIAAIGEVSLESESAITAARTAYDALTDAQKKLVTKLDVLTAAEAKLAELKADKAAAQAVDEQISAIGEVTKESEEAIKAARTAYDTLTDAQKALVTKLSVLTAAEEKLAALNGGSGGSNEKKITVTMRLIGAERAAKDVDLGAEAYLPNYVTWIPTTTYELKEGATVYDLWVLATADAGIRSVGADNNYVKTVYAPSGYELSEFTNGARSGWMYTIGGSHPGYGLKEQALHDGDVVIWHYINDYSYECADWFSEGQWQALGDGTYYNQWLKAPDTYLGTGGGVGGSSGSGSGSGTGSGSEGTVPENGTTTKTVEGEDGSTSTIVTETTGSTVTNEDGSVTDTVTEKVTETVTDADGNVTKTETVTETETTTNTVENADGSTTETTVTTETITETVTAEDGTVNKTETVNSSETTTNTITNADGSTTAAEETTTTVTETSTADDGSNTVAETETTVTTEITGKTNADGSTTETAVTETKETTTTTVTAADGTVTESVAETTHTKTLETTVTADGKTTGSGTVSSTAIITAADGSKSTVKTEGTIVVDTDDKGTVSEVTTEKTVTTAADGSKTEAITVTTAATTVDGSTATVVEDEDGNILSAEVTISEEALDKALESGEPINVPANVNPAEDYASGTAINFTMPFFEDKLEVEIEIRRDGPGIVAYIRQPSGELSLVKECRRGSVIVPVETDCEIVIADNTKRFPDVGTEKWFYDPVTFVTAREIFNGYDDGSFGPEKMMNRAMVAQILYNLNRNAAPGSSRFGDVAANAWYSAAVSWAAEKGIVQGYDGKYRPLDDITRQDLVTIFYRYAKFSGYDLSISKGTSLAGYTDGAEVSNYASEAMRWAISKGIITGYEDGSLRPKDTATRAQVAAVMQRFIENVVR